MATRRGTGERGHRGERPAEPETLSPQVFHILLSLGDTPRHGYGILLEVQERTGGEIVLGAGTLYSAIKRLRRQGWIEEAPAPRRQEVDPRRKHYRLTKAGRAAMVGEALRLRALVEQARLKAVLPEGSLG